MEFIYLSRVEGPMSRVESGGSRVKLLLNDDLFSEDIFFFAGQSSSVYMFLPDLI